MDIAALQSELQVSLTALREALKVLAAKGMVDARQRRGTFVRSRAHWNLLDEDVIYWHFADRQDKRMLDSLREVRTIVELAAARLAAERASDEQIRSLNRVITRMAQAREHVAVVAADVAFHRSLLQATDNEVLDQLEVVIATVTERAGQAAPVPGASELVPSHQALIDAIRMRDPDAAETAMRAVLCLHEAGLHRLPAPHRAHRRVVERMKGS